MDCLMKNISLLLFVVLVVSIALVSSCGKDEKTPVYTKVAIAKFEVSQIPFTTPSGASWEDLPLVEQGPDVYWMVTDANDSVYYGSRDLRFDNVTTAHLPLVRVLAQPLILTPLNASWFIKVYDYDLIGGDDLMATIGPFNFNGYTKDFPPMITVTGDSAIVKVDINWRE
jgi:hypothetical protein